MIIFNSAMEGSATKQYLLNPLMNNNPITTYILEGKFSKYNLLSYYYIQKTKELSHIDYVKEHSELILIDSGAHTFQFGTKVDFDAFCRNYADFIKKFDNNKVLGYFELDIENIVGMDKVLEYRKILEDVTDKIIPVWHKGRGINNYEEMLEQYRGKVIAIGGFKGTDIRDDQYLMFLKKAKRYNCKVHCLGMTRSKVLDKVPFDFTDSASWLNWSIYGTIFNNGKKVSKQYSKEHQLESMAFAFKTAIEMQEHYYNKWRNICND
jgi:hypothetical protein